MSSIKWFENRDVPDSNPETKTLVNFFLFVNFDGRSYLVLVVGGGDNLQVFCEIS